MTDSLWIHDIAVWWSVVDGPSWTDEVSAWAAVATGVFSAIVAVIALLAWRTARDTLLATREAAVATRDAAIAARESNNQARLDSIEQTRPYVYAQIVAGLNGMGMWDIRIVNAGKSAARDLTLTYDRWPDAPDDIAVSLRTLFATPRTLPPGCSIRAIWRLSAGSGHFDDGTTQAGLGTEGQLSVSYTSTDPAHPVYTDTFDVMIEGSGLSPVPEAGPEVNGLKDTERKFYLLGQAIARRIGELSR